ncbi:hypothetical protein ZWY2020_040665 [Hordeum vulgare]|nr:hypothetical protein ZWY2020_040665 [Hordeum vulgare]
MVTGAAWNATGTQDSSVFGLCYVLKDGIFASGAVLTLVATALGSPPPSCSAGSRPLPLRPPPCSRKASRCRLQSPGSRWGNRSYRSSLPSGRGTAKRRTRTTPSSGTRLWSARSQPAAARAALPSCTRLRAVPDTNR